MTQTSPPILHTVLDHDALEKALTVRDDIRGRLDDSRMGLVEIDSERARIAFAAHTDGGNAKKELDTLNKPRMLQLCDIEGLESAMLEASRRVESANADTAPIVCAGNGYAELAQMAEEFQARNPFLSTAQALRTQS